MNRSAAMTAQDEYADENGDRSLTEQLDLQHYLRILRKHKWLITLFTAAVTMFAAYYAFTATPIYRANSTLLIEQQKANLVSIEELYGLENENTDYYQTQFELLKSRALAQKVVERLELWDHPELSAAARAEAAQSDAAHREILGSEDASLLGRVNGLLASIGLVRGAPEEGVPGAEPTTRAAADVGTAENVAIDMSAESPVLSGGEQGMVAPDLASTSYGGEGPSLAPDQEKVLAAFMSRLSISPVRKTKLVNIGYESADPVLAARVANTVGDQYIKSYLDAKLEMTTTASEWLSTRLGELKIDLDEAEDRLVAFKQANGLVDVDGSVGRLNEQQLLLLTAELAQARSELAAARDVYNDVQSLNGNSELLESIPAVQSDPLVQQVKIQQGTVQRELDELLNRYGERHPRVLDAKSELASLSATLEGHIRRVSGTIAKDFQLAEQRVASINSKLASGKNEIQALGNQKFELDALQREVETKQGVYDQFYSRMTEARSADGLETANARVSDFARPPVSPVKPKKQLIIALAALASLVLSMLMAFLYETMDDTIKSTNDIEGKLGLRLLGILPLIKSGILKTRQALPLNPAEIPDKKGTFSEAVNTVRTALCLDDGAHRRRVIVVTSSIPGEGKSTAAINLAHSLGQLERVLLIDCDMRRPTIAKAAGLDKSVPGLSNLITGSAAARECIHQEVFGGSVSILPSGPIPDQPLELLSSRRFEKILAELSNHYDRIVVDSAPTQAVSDALVLSRLADAVVYVIKSHETSIELVKRGIQRLEQAGAPIAGALITQVDIDKITSYGGDYYYQGYYDYYGYTDKKERQKRPGKIRLTQEELLAIKNDDSAVDLGLEYEGMDVSNGHRRGPGSPSDDRASLSNGAAGRGRVAAAQRRETVNARQRFEDDLDII